MSWEWYMLAADAAVAAGLYILHRNTNRNIQNIKNAPNFTANADLRKQLTGAVEGCMPYVCISGDVHASDKAITRTTTDGQHDGVVHQRTITEHGSHRIQGFWSDKNRVIQDNWEAVDFTLGSGKNAVLVCNPVEAELMEESMQIISDQYQETKQPFLNRALDTLSGQIFRGVSETERMLKVGTRLLGIGKLTLYGNTLKLEKPDSGMYLLTMRTKSEVLGWLAKQRKVARRGLYVCALLGICVMAVSAYRRYQIWLEQRQFRERVSELRRIQATQPHEGDHIIEPCVVCLGAQKEVILLECAHVCVCVSCSEQLPSPKQCPVCRAPVTRMLPVFL